MEEEKTAVEVSVSPPPEPVADVSVVPAPEWKEVKHDLPIFNESTGSMELPAKSIETDFAIPDALDLASVMPENKEQAVNRDMLMDIIRVEGKPDDVEKFKAICATHAPKGSPMAVMTTCGLPLGVVQSMLREAQQINDKINLLVDKIVVTPRIKRNCRKCNGSGTMGRMANTAWTPKNGQPKFHDYKVKCPCLHLEMKLEKPPEIEPPVQPKAEDATQSSGQGQPA